MTLLLSLALATAGFMLLALAMDRHHHQLWRRSPTALRRWQLRSLGATLLTGSLFVCAHASGWGTGLVQWMGLLSVSALCVVLGLSYLADVARSKMPKR